MATISVPFTGGIGNGTQTTHSIKFPAGVTEATIHLWGTGGAGGGCPSATTGSGGGGAGGQYARSVITVDDETTYTLRVGDRRTGTTGDGGDGVDSDWETDVIVAKGGAGGLGAVNGGTGGAGSSVGGVGDVVYAGGSGSDGDGTTASGAGGGGAGTTGAGGNASGTTAGTGTSEDGGNGGGGRTFASAGIGGLSYGGGGGGGLNTATSNRNGGVGGQGGAIIEFEYGNAEISSWAELASIQEVGSLFLYLDYILTESLDKDSTGYSTYASSTANSGEGWIPIGINIARFEGTFNGQFNTIGDLYINRGTVSRQGLFGHTGGGTIKNLGVVDCDITVQQDFVGALAGIAGSALVEKCWSTGEISARGSVGGLCGSNPTLMRQCWSSVNVTATQTITTSHTAGGLLGGLRDATENCYCKGTVTAAADDVRRGGLAPQATDVRVENCYTISDTNPTGGSQGGGMVGYQSGTITDTNNFYDTTATGWATSEIGTGKTTAEMKDKDTYTDWDFDDVWDIRPDRNDGYPYLRWEYPDDEPVLTGAAFLLLMV